MAGGVWVSALGGIALFGYFFGEEEFWLVLGSKSMELGVCVMFVCVGEVRFLFLVVVVCVRKLYGCSCWDWNPTYELLLQATMRMLNLAMLATFGKSRYPLHFQCRNVSRWQEIRQKLLLFVSLHLGPTARGQLHLPGALHVELHAAEKMQHWTLHLIIMLSLSILNNKQNTLVSLRYTITGKGWSWLSSTECRCRHCH